MCLAVASCSSSDRIKIHVSLCGNGEEGGKGGLDESIEEGARLQESYRSLEIARKQLARRLNIEGRIREIRN